MIPPGLDQEDRTLWLSLKHLFCPLQAPRHQVKGNPRILALPRWHLLQWARQSDEVADCGVLQLGPNRY